MKKIFTAIFLVFITLHASSQVDVGIFAGPQRTSVKYVVQGVQQKDDTKTGFQAGVALKVPFENNLYFVPMGFYSLKGYKVTLNRYVYPPDVNAADNNTTLHNFELAALLQYDFSNKPGHFFVRIGPSLDFQLVGNEKFNLIGGGSVDRKMKFGPGEYGRYLANYLGHFGYESASGWMIFGQYTYGAANMNNADGGPAIRHRAYGITIGKYLNKKKIVMDTRNKE